MHTLARAALQIAASCFGQAGAQQTLSIAAGGGYDPVGGGYAQIIDQVVEGYSGSVEVTNASVENVAFVSRGNSYLALAATMLAAYEGTARCGPDGELPQLANPRVITSAYANAVHVITLEGSGIESLADTPGVGTPNLLIASSDMPAEPAYEFTKAPFENTEVAHAIHPSANQTAPEIAVTSPVPLHVGVIQYLEEVGIAVPDRLEVG